MWIALGVCVAFLIVSMKALDFWLRRSDDPFIKMVLACIIILICGVGSIGLMGAIIYRAVAT